jgi:hypothetical protein
MEEAPEIQPKPEEESGDPSHELDLVTIFRALGADAELEAMALHNLLRANGIPAVMFGSSTLPNLPFAVKVPKDLLDESLRIIAQAKAAGPAAAEEAQRAAAEGESGGS